MENFTVNAQNREKMGSSNCRRLLRKGQLPGVIYGLGENKSVVLDPVALKNLLLSEGGKNRILMLEGPGLSGKNAIVKDYQVDPVSRQLIHIDLLEIDPTKQVQVTVRINFVGKCVGVADGGVLNLVEREVAIKTLPSNIPPYIDVDVTNLKIGESLHANDISLPQGVERAHPHLNPTIVTVVPPTKEEEAQVNLSESATGPEVITEKKAEEGAADGAAPAAGGKAAAPAAGKAAPAKEGAKDKK